MKKVLIVVLLIAPLTAFAQATTMRNVYGGENYQRQLCASITDTAVT